MLGLTRGRLLGLGALTAVIASAACQVLAGIDEKTAAVVVPDATTTEPDGATPPECTTNAECVAARSTGYVCVKETGRCQSLFSAECDTILGGTLTATPAEKQDLYANDDTLFLGLVMDLKGAGRSTGIARRQGVALALDAIARNRGVPGGPGGRRRPVAVVACSETKDDGSSDPKVPARHLIDDLHVPAIIGASNSDTTSEMFFNAALPGTLVFAPNALSSRLSSPQDNGLFWRTSTASPAHAQAMRQQINAIYTDLVTNRGVTAREARLAVVYLNNGFGQDLVDQIMPALSWNEASVDDASSANGELCTTTPCTGPRRVLRLSYTDTSPEGLAALATELKFFFEPDLVVLVGGADAITIARSYEDIATTEPAVFSPSYLFAQGSATTDLTTILTANAGDAGLRPRVRGVRQRLAADEPTVFAGAYSAAFPSGPPSTIGVPGAHDIAYLLAYAAAAAPGDAGAPLTGARLAEGLKRVLDSTSTATFRTSADAVPAATDALAAGQTINVKGYSYTEAFDLDAGEAPSKLDIFCVSGSNVLSPSGQTYDPSTDASTGTYACP